MVQRSEYVIRNQQSCEQMVTFKNSRWLRPDEIRPGQELLYTLPVTMCCNGYGNPCQPVDRIQKKE